MQNGTETKRGQRTWINWMIELLKGGFLAVCAAVVVLLAAAWLMNVGALDRGMMENSVVVACVLGALAGGLYANKRCERAKLPVGIGTGMVAFLLLLLVGGVFFDGVGGGGGVCLVGTACVCGGLLSGVLSAVGKGGRKQRR